MTRHLLRLIWNRKRANFLILTEIFISFLVLFAVVLVVLQLSSNYRQPLGFEVANLWSVSLSPREDPGAATAAPLTEEERTAQSKATVDRLLTALRDMPQVEAGCALTVMPYTNSSWTQTIKVGGRSFRYNVNMMTDDCRHVMNLVLTRGRWFSRADDGLAGIPVVVNERLAREMFGDRDPIGQPIAEDDEAKGPPNVHDPGRMRVVGIIQDFRQDGELSVPVPYMIRRADLRSAMGGSPENLALKMRAGTTAQVEETLVRQLQAVAPSWSFQTQPVPLLRADTWRSRITPVAAFAIIAGFLLMMVALGLTGVVWQNVTQRTREFGLRRAKGATQTDVRRQVLAELSLMTTLALVAGVLLVIQLPLLPLPAELRSFSATVFLGGLVLSVVAMYLLTLGCAWYPSRLATRIQPADALHYE